MRRVKQHTLEKLEYLRKYLEFYLKATKKIPRKYYIDAFAGTGKCVLCGNKKCKSKGGYRCENCKHGEKIVNGSALISLDIENSFDGYFLVELDKNKIDVLKNYIKSGVPEDRAKKVQYVQGDCNIVLNELPKKIIDDACMVFLDPEGAELLWSTVVSLSKLRRVDLLILYPYDMGLVRLTKNYKNKLNKFYGTEKWYDFYDKGIFPLDRKIKLLNFYRDNLVKLGLKCVEPKQIRQKLKSGHPLYHLIFASHNDMAVKVMSQIFNKDLDGQTKMF